jgi:RNA 2',3'-cyclic 3'-phosphodiesterase
MSRAPRQRLFVAVDVPAAELAAVDEAVTELRSRLPPPFGRWAAPENRHVTLKFLGATDADKVPLVSESIREVAAHRAPARVALQGLGAFPSARRARVLWVGLSDPTGLLAKLAGDLDQALEPLGFRIENRAFTPHLTLARLRPAVPLELPPEVPAGTPFDIAEVDLFRSHLHPRGARYELLEAFPLEGRDP